MIEYKVNINGREIVYGALTQNSKFSDEEWYAIHSEIVKKNDEDAYEKYKDDEFAINSFGRLIDLEERYEVLLELLPCSWSKAGTHPKWVADEVNENTLDKGITQDDIADMINDYEDVDDLKEVLKEYLDIKKYHGSKLFDYKP